MENNEVEEYSEEETQETATSAEETETQEEGQEETKDWKAEALKYKAIAERKDKKLQKEEKSEPNKTNTENTGLTREEAIFYAKGGDDETLALAQKIANVEGISLLAAMEDDLYKSKVASMQEEEKKKENSVGASKGSQTGAGHKPKPIGKMTEEEHREHMKKFVPEMR